MNRFLLDTNIVSELTRVKPEQNVTHWFSSVDESGLFMSVLTIGEIRKGLSAIPQAKKKLDLEKWFVDLKYRFTGRLLNIDDSVAEQWGILSAAARKQGKPLSVVDGLLAATAISHNLILVTRNVNDFAIDKLSILNPWSSHP
jgi:predicted nucleic acid-binding protein